MTIRGIRGATTIESDSKEHVLSATRELLDAILESNPDLKTDDIASALSSIPRLAHHFCMSRAPPPATFDPHDIQFNARVRSTMLE